MWTGAGWRLALLLHGEKTHVTESPWSAGATLGRVLACGFTTFRFRGENRGSEGPPGAGRGGAEGSTMPQQRKEQEASVQRRWGLRRCAPIDPSCL